MKPGDLKPGMYVISKDIANPKADRRKPDFSALPIWSQGRRVAVEHWTFEEIRIYPPGSYAHNGVVSRHPGFKALVAALQPVEWTNHEWVSVNVRCPDRVLVKLLEAGKITRKDLLGKSK